MNLNFQSWFDWMLALSSGIQCQNVSRDGSQFTGLYKVILELLLRMQKRIRVRMHFKLEYVDSGMPVV